MVHFFIQRGNLGGGGGSHIHAASMSITVLFHTWDFGKYSSFLWKQKQNLKWNDLILHNHAVQWVGIEQKTWEDAENTINHCSLVVWGPGILRCGKWDI